MFPSKGFCWFVSGSYLLADKHNRPTNLGLPISNACPVWDMVDAEKAAFFLFSFVSILSFVGQQI